MTDAWGRTIVLSGQHAFGYSITIITLFGVTRMDYPNGKEARKAYNKFRKKRI